MSVSLSEQIGAMALVDQLRHREMEIQEHLDLPQRRAEVAERIRSYYQNNAIAFDDAQVEQGVRQFFSQRLLFEAPPLGRLQRLLTRLVMARRKLLHWAIGGVLAIILAAGGVLVVERAMNIRLEQKTERLNTDIEALKSQLDTQRQRLMQLKARVKRDPQPTAGKLLTTIDRLLPVTLPAAVVAPDPITGDNRATLKMRLEQARFELAGVRENLNNARKRLNRVDHLYTTLDQQQRIHARLTAMPLPGAERKMLMDWYNKTGTDIAALQLEAADGTLKVLKAYLDYAAKPLTLELIDRPGIKSGVERCYDAAGCSANSTHGKSWYLIVEALDSSGQAEQVPVTSVEDGKTQWANRFGVRVSYDEYLNVRQDKLDDGHISQRLIASKPANTLTLRFGKRTGPVPDMILQW